MTRSRRTDCPDAANFLPACLALFAAWSLLALVPQRACAELRVIKSDVDDGELTTFRLRVTPAAEPAPALRHRLRLREIDLKAGNAAPYYYRCLMGAAANRKAVADKFGDEFYSWIQLDKTSLSELPLEQVREATDHWDGPVMQNLRSATSLRHCDWQWNLEDIRGPELIAFLLEEIQESRSLCRALLLKTRLALAENRTDDAIDLLRINYRLARDVAREPLLVCDLVGIAIAGRGNWGAIELIAQPGSPNLFWALSELPRPLIQIQKSIRTEMSLGLRTFPFLIDAETAEHSPEEWARLLARGYLESLSLMSSPPVRIEDSQVTLAQAGIAAMSLAVYPKAKERLAAAGMTAEEIDAMPVGQVIAIDALHEYQKVADELEKWQYIPYATMRQRQIKDPFTVHGPMGMMSRGFGYSLAATLLPAIQAANSAEQRLLWQTDAIRVIEAIRMHTASTGKLPNSLSDIRVVPVPANPATGEEFLYTLDGATAILELPFSDGFPGVSYRFEIQLEQ